MAEQQQLLRVPEVARILSLSRSQVYKLIEQGLPVVRIGRSVRVRPGALHAWLEEQEQLTARQRYCIR